MTQANRIDNLDASAVTGNLMQTDLMQSEGSDLWKGNISSLDVLEPAGQSGNSMNKTYRVTVDGATYNLEGADVMALAASLKANNYSDEKYGKLFQMATTIRKEAGDMFSQGLFDELLVQRYSTIRKMYDSVF